MKKIYWDEGLSVGDPIIDDEHRQLIAQLNGLIDLIDESPDFEQVHRILDELESLAARHSRYEETLSLTAGAEFKDEQCREHHEFRTAIIEARGQLDPNDLENSLIDLTESLVSLLINHIIDQDLDLAPLLAERQVREHSLAEFLVLRFQKISLVRGLEMLVIISLLPMLVFAGMIMLESWQVAVRANDIALLASFSERVGNLAHELQKERGLSAGYLTSDDKAYRAALTLQRKYSDDSLAQFSRSVTKQKLENGLSTVGDMAAVAIVRMKRLEGVREKVDRNGLAPQVSFKLFTELISELMGLSNQIASVSRHERASELFQANAILIQFGEMAGQERAVNAAAFGRGKLTPAEYRLLVTLTSEQQSLKRQFRTFVNDETWLAWQQWFDSEVIRDYQRFSEYALEQGGGRAALSLDSFTWFKTATKRVNLIRDFQRELTKQLLKEMSRQRSRSTALFMSTVLGGGAMVLLIGYVALQLARSIRLPIVSLTEGMRGLTEGDKTVRIPFSSRQDELGDMVSAYETFRRKLIRSDVLSMGQELKPLATSRYALALKRTTAKGEEYKRLASIDALTGVINRREFIVLAKKEVSRLQRHADNLSVLILDVDYFKQINDTHGHSEGDRVLKIVAQTIAAALREADVLGRIGGEEFAVLLPSTDEPAAQVTAERIRSAIERLRIQIGDQEIQITISIGVSEYQLTEGLIDSAMLRADKALYQAKHKGRNRVCCERSAYVQLLDECPG
jgi:two-component system cell cycle response regulator